MKIDVENVGGYVVLVSAVLMFVYWITFAIALPMKEKYINWVLSPNWVWVNSIGFFAAVLGIIGAFFIARYIGEGYLNYAALALVVLGSVMMTALLYFEAFILPGLAKSTPFLVDQSSAFYNFATFKTARILGGICFSLGFIFWAFLWMKDTNVSTWASVSIIFGAPLFSLVFLPGNLRLVGVVFYCVGLIGVGLNMLSK